MRNLLEYRRAMTVLGATFMAASGACWGYVYASNELEKTFEARVDEAIAEEVDKTRRFYATRYKDFGPEELSTLGPEDFDKPEEPVVVSERQIVIPEDVLATPEGREMVRKALNQMASEPAEVEVVGEDWPDPEYVDEAAMIANRSSETPYVVSKDEFMMNEAHYEVYQLTFFEGDGTLLDDQEENIPDTVQVLGHDFEKMFGVMSENNNTVYIQNDISEALFEVTRSRMSGVEALYGVQASDEDIIEHSSMKSRRRRGDDN